MSKKPQQQMNDDAGEIETTAPATKKKAKPVRSKVTLAATVARTVSQLDERVARHLANAEEAQAARKEYVGKQDPEVLAMAGRLLGRDLSDEAAVN